MSSANLIPTELKGKNLGNKMPNLMLTLMNRDALTAIIVLVTSHILLNLNFSMLYRPTIVRR